MKYGVPVPFNSILPSPSPPGCIELFVRQKNKNLNLGKQYSSTEINTHLVCVFPVVPKKMTHGPVIASVGPTATLTIHVEGIFI